MKNSILLLLTFFLFSHPVWLTAQQHCDTLFLKSGDHILVRNVQVLSKHISYEKCGKSDGKSYLLPKERYASLKHSSKSNGLFSENDSTAIYEIWVHSGMDKRTTGDLHGFKDSSILILSNFGPSPEMKEFLVRDIEFIEVRKKGKLTKSASIGILAGLATGLVYGLYLKNRLDDTFESSGLITRTDGSSVNLDVPFLVVYPALGALSGGIIGSIIGSIKVSIPIKGHQDIYEAQIRKFEY